MRCLLLLLWFQCWRPPECLTCGLGAAYAGLRALMPAGGRYWRLKYRVNGKEKRLAFGVYADVGLKEAADYRNRRAGSPRGAEANRQPLRTLQRPPRAQRDQPRVSIRHQGRHG